MRRGIMGAFLFPVRSLGAAHMLVPLAVILVCSVLLALSLIKRSTAPIDLSARAEVVTLYVGNDAVELPPFRATKITVIGDGALKGGIGVTAFHSVIQVDKPADASTGWAGLSLSGLKLAPRSKLTTRRQPGIKGGFEFIVTNSQSQNSELRIIAEGAVEVSADARQRRMLPTDITTIDLSMGSAPFVLRITLAEDEWSVQRPFAISGLDFRDTAIEGDPSRIFSALKGGSVSFLDIGSLDGDERRMALLPRQMLIIGSIREGYARTFSIAQDEIAIGMTGEVTELRTMWKSAVYDHMPTLLATWSSDGLISKLAVFGLAVFAAFLPLMYRARDEP